MTKILTEEEFDSKFTITFRTDDFYAIQKCAKEYLWTVVEGDDSNLYLRPGFAVVNRLEYIITKEPHNFEYDEVVWCIFEEEEV